MMTKQEIDKVYNEGYKNGYEAGRNEALELESKFEIVCRALVSIMDKEGSDYGYTEACDIADMYCNG